MLQLPVYMDNHATTRGDPRVVAEIVPLFDQQYGNPGSTSHGFGWDAKDLVDSARVSIAENIGASDKEIVFTSGATESNNLALRGISHRANRTGNQIISVCTEHKAILDPLDRLARDGVNVTLLPVQQTAGLDAGLLSPAQVAEAISDDTFLVSVMLANNEIGVIQPIAEIGAICRERGVLFHTDATQAVGRVPVDVEKLNVDLMSFSAHKIYGPKGSGALYVRRKSVRLAAQIDGGGQEGGRRSGTLNPVGILGLAMALRLCIEELDGETLRLERLRNRLWKGISAIDDVLLNGPDLSNHLRLPGNLNCSFIDVDGEALMMSMKDLAVSSGSACTSNNPEPSHVLRHLGLNDDTTRASLRFGLGRFNTEAEVDFAIDLVRQNVEKLRSMRSL